MPNHGITGGAVLAASVSQGATAGGTLTEIAAVTLDGYYDWLTVVVKSTIAALTNAAVYERTSSGGAWIPRIEGAEFADGLNFGDGEISGVDDQGNGNYAYELGIGESALLRLRVTGLQAIQFKALGDTAVVTVVGIATKGA